jgi:hypothetical protein
MLQFVVHKIHRRGNVGEKLAIVLTQETESRFAIGGMAETVFGAAAITCKEPPAIHTLPRQTVMFIAPELRLSEAVHH